MSVDRVLILTMSAFHGGRIYAIPWLVFFVLGCVVVIYLPRAWAGAVAVAVAWKYPPLFPLLCFSPFSFLVSAEVSEVRSRRLVALALVVFLNTKAVFLR